MSPCATFIARRACRTSRTYVDAKANVNKKKIEMHPIISTSYSAKRMKEVTDRHTDRIQPWF